MNIVLPQRKTAGTIMAPNIEPVVLSERPNIHELTVQGVIAYMQSHISESLSLGRLSDVGGFSPWHLDRIFTRATGLATMRYLTLLRIEAAKNAALSTDRRIIEIAYDVGFNSLGSFGKRFTQLVGMSPRDLRKAADRFDIGRWKAMLDDVCGQRPDLFRGFGAREKDGRDSWPHHRCQVGLRTDGRDSNASIRHWWPIRRPAVWLHRVCDRLPSIQCRHR